MPTPKEVFGDKNKTDESATDDTGFVSEEEFIIGVDGKRYSMKDYNDQ